MQTYRFLTVLGVVIALVGAVYAHDGHMHQHSAAADGDDETFKAKMHRAMMTMDHDMNVALSGDPDRDFAAMMIPHHQGAIDMARIQLQFGRDPVLRRLAQGIIVEQLQEIAVMQRALAQLPSPPQPAAAPTSTDQTNK